MCAVVAACAYLALGATMAAASTLTITPSGAMTERSVEKVTFRSTEGSSIECAARSSATLASSATGELTTEPRPEVNPVIGESSEVTYSECVGSGRVISLPSRQTWTVNRQLSLHLWSVTKLPFRFLVEEILIDCLYTAGATFKYEEGTGRLIRTSTIVLAASSLVLGRCSDWSVIETSALQEGGGRSPTIALR
jgi:hypothetical protein